MKTKPTTHKALVRATPELRTQLALLGNEPGLLRVLDKYGGVIALGWYNSSINMLVTTDERRPAGIYSSWDICYQGEVLYRSPALPVAELYAPGDMLVVELV